METIIAEAQRLEKAGVKEIIIISQDSTDYGHDLGLRNGLSHLLNEIVQAVPNMPLDANHVRLSRLRNR